ncbi:Lrp/AsnC family transcriptional regulator [Clostridium sp. MSJ-11]|uniref:Lrp/AsnC family transcriptional regulator n=1 Tax=Clostridium mobile TaxID=2841512 RepID=A0ABS6EIJ5_9CLOT|nr:Lrp/AsnC family transcriptional regulator [Clostridium mobile]MBU5484511.1 Lrp/AsnC family transcriptional regulator [Clostridium mobile]
MDSTNHKIIETLVEDGRISIKELAQKVCLSAPAAAERVKRLEEDGIIKGYKAIIDYEKIGQTINVLINLDMNIQQNEKFMEFIKNEDSIIECHHVTGPYCKILKARVSNISDLENLIGKIQMFGNTETFIVLSSTIKDNVKIDTK